MSDSGDDGGYVHEPGQFDETGTRGDGPDAERRTTKAYTPDAPESDGFGARGWLLVVALLVAFIVVPGVVLFLPQLRPVIAALGLTFRDAYLVLPLIPALGLGALAVWVALAGRERPG